jgi:flagellar biosynthesis/type III secretory pathway protein FliH
LCVTDLPANQLSALIAQILDKPTESYVMSTANRLKQEGKAEGKAEGIAEATAEARERLLRQLAVRFGNVPSSIESRVRRASKQDLDVWSIRLLKAKSLLEVFAGE